MGEEVGEADDACGVGGIGEALIPFAERPVGGQEDVALLFMTTRETTSKSKSV